MLSELMPVTLHDPLVVEARTERQTQAKAFPLHAGMSAKEVAHALLEVAARREIAETRLW